MYRLIVFISLFGMILNLSAQNWVVQPVDSCGICDCSISVDSMCYPHIAYPWRNDTATNRYICWVKYAKWNGSNWQSTPIESTYWWSFPLAGGYFLQAKLILDQQSEPHCAYIRLQYPETLLYIKHAYWNDTVWQRTKIDSMYIGRFDAHFINERRNLDLTLSRNGIPYICYPFVNRTALIWGVKYAYKSADSWIIRTIWQTQFDPYLNVYPWTPISRTRIALDTSGKPVVAFEYHNGWKCWLNVAFWEHDDVWRIERIDSTDLWSDIMTPFSLKIDEMNRIHVLYHDCFRVMYAVKENNNWVIEWTGTTVDMTGNNGELALYNGNPHCVSTSPMVPIIYRYRLNGIWYGEVVYSGDNLNPSLAIDRYGNKHVCFIQDYLYYARRIAPGIEDERLTPYATHNTLEVFPNPARTYFNVRSTLNAQGSTLRIFDVTGEVVKEARVKGTQDARISTEGIKNGVYFVQVDNESEMKKLVITK